MMMAAEEYSRSKTVIVRGEMFNDKWIAENSKEG
jgi:hypothetical protein